ncbi:MAG TPA: DUF190 domain-containing protein [Pseudonocardiaceae bacterium]|nr:DUF190 domain-containing protein [Pseudonocardiaceae bacterium]
MKLHGFALRLTIFIGDTDLWHHRRLYHEIVYRAHEAGLAGASVSRGMAATACPRASTRRGSCGCPR